MTMHLKLATPVLRPLTDAEYLAWLAEAVPAYARDKVASGAWAREGALERSAREHADLLPRGRDTPENFLYAILDADGAQVGVLWFAIQERGDGRVAYVYDVEIAPEHRRRGHATRAFRALEGEARRLGLAGIALHVFGHNHAAQAFYARLGYEPTNLNLYKPVAPQGT